MKREQLNTPDNQKRSYPFGSGKRERTHEVPAVYVDNTVEWVNSDVVGEGISFVKDMPTRLALFVTHRKDVLNKKVNVRPGHRRSRIVGQVTFRDNFGTVYRDIDAKGGGFIVEVPDTLGRKITLFPVPLLPHPTEGETAGIFNFPDAKKDADLTQAFMRLGVRTCPYLAITRLHELPANLVVMESSKQNISIQKAKKLGMIHQDSDPVIAFRAFTTASRISDLILTPDYVARTENDIAKKELDDAIELVRQELNKDSFSPEEYLSWFSKTLAENIAKIHNQRLIHGYLTNHNITLDCRILDFDGVEQSNEEAPGVDPTKMRASAQHQRGKRGLNLADYDQKSNGFVRDVLAGLSVLQNLFIATSVIYGEKLRTATGVQLAIDFRKSYERIIHSF